MRLFPKAIIVSNIANLGLITILVLHKLIFLNFIRMKTYISNHISGSKLDNNSDNKNSK